VRIDDVVVIFLDGRSTNRPLSEGRDRASERKDVVDEVESVCGVLKVQIEERAGWKRD